MRKVFWFIFLSLGALPSALACTVCNGDPADPQTRAAKAAMITMIVVTYLVVGWVLVKFIRLIRRQSQ